MRSGGLSWIVAIGVSTSGVLAAACGTGVGPSTGSGDLATSLPPPASLAVAPGDVTETTLDAPIGVVGPIDISRIDVSVRRGTSGSTVKADVRATVLETIDTLQLDYCGPPLRFLSVDGSTVVVTLEDDTLRAPLHSPLPADTEFAFRFLALVPLDHAAEQSVGDVAGDLFCR